MQRTMFKRCGFHWEGGYAEGLALRRDTPASSYALPAVIALASTWYAVSEPESGLWVYALILLSVGWLLWIAARATVCVSAHRDRLTWHGFWRSRVVHWSRIDTVRVIGGRIHLTRHGHLAPTSFRLLGVSSWELQKELQQLAQDGRIPDSVRFE